MPAHPLARTVLALAVAGAAAGCGIHEPYRTTATTTSSPAARPTSPPAADQRDPAPERGGTIPSSAQARNERSRPAPEAPARRPRSHATPPRTSTGTPAT